MENSHDKQPMHQWARASVKQNAGNNRQNNTPAEAALWEAIRLKKLDGFKFRNQHAIGAYVVDFYCHEAKLAIEVDGEYHLEPNQKEYDEERTLRIEASGVKIIRFTNQEVLTNLEAVLVKIRACLKR
ncbi:MAG: endonuclease domain-containing protein [Lewinellaceae bacterium]|nr:endonuclease domain-containing protein [Lewinellaceae bacterium]